MQSIIHLNRKDIDVTKWDNCILQSSNSLIYAYSFFLDHFAPKWSALVNSNYDWVMPIISNRKWGIAYLYQPVFTQQLGVYCLPNAEVPFLEIEAWLKEQFNYWEINVNKQTADSFNNNKIQKTAATNFVIDLSKSYEKITAVYHNDLNKNLKKSSHFQLTYKEINNFEESLQMYIRHYGVRTPKVTNDDYERFKKLCKKLSQNNQLFCRAAINQNGNILSIALLFSDGKRLYNMMNTTTQEGRKMSSNHFLIDAIIKEFAESEWKFDFEGSDLPGVKSFYENFGAQNEPYYQLKYNNLPLPLRMLKK